MGEQIHLMDAGEKSCQNFACNPTALQDKGMAINNFAVENAFWPSCVVLCYFKISFHICFLSFIRQNWNDNKINTSLQIGRNLILFVLKNYNMTYCLYWDSSECRFVNAAAIVWETVFFQQLITDDQHVHPSFVMQKNHSHYLRESTQGLWIDWILHPSTVSLIWLPSKFVKMGASGVIAMPASTISTKITSYNSWIFHEAVQSLLFCATFSPCLATISCLHHCKSPCQQALIMCSCWKYSVPSVHFL